MLDSPAKGREVSALLQAAIESGEFGPGDRLPPERELVERFGVSRVIVREGLRALQAAGIVTVQHGRGTFVAVRPTDSYAGSFTHWLSVHRDQFLELQRIRGTLDVLAVEGAAVNARAKDLKRLARLSDGFEKAASRRAGVEALAAIDLDFHVAIAEASGSRLLQKLLGTLHRRLNEARLLSLAPAERPLASAAEHRAIVRALEAGSPDDARAAAEAHTAAATASLERALETARSQEPEEARE
jgi:DNA-binding FadR family transcriptional regulator